MKKTVLILGIIVASGAMSLISCSGSDESTEQSEKKEYYCPMKCEDDKMYAEEGQCPVCKMDLVKD
jgi:ABC-type oligopeptide transport system substrate-binding subunit